MRIFGDRLLVEKILEKDTAVQKEGVFKNVVKVLGIGDGFNKDYKINVGDKLLVGGTLDLNGESFVIDKQILRWVD